MDTTTTHRGAGARPAPSHHADELSALAEAVPALVFVTDSDGWLLQANQRFQRYAGLDDDTLAGSTWLSFVHVHDRARALAAWDAARREGGAFELPLRLAQAAGRCEAFDCRAVPVYLDGEVDRWTFAAMAAQGEPGKAPPERDDHWPRHAFEHAGVGLARVGPDGRMLAVNEHLCRLLGCSRAQLLGSDLRQLAADADQADTAALLPGDCDRRRIEQRWRRADGSAVPVALCISRVPAEDGACGHFVCVVEDLGARQAAALAEHESMLEQFVQSASVALALFDGDMRYLAHSGGYPAELGLPPGQLLVDRSHYEVLPEAPRRWREIHARVLQGEEHCSDAEPFHRPDGSTDWVRWAMRPWRRRSSAIGGAVLFFEVVTARVLAERAQQDAMQRLREREAQHRRNAELLMRCLEAAPFAVWAKDDKGRWLLANSAAAALLAPAHPTSPGRAVNGVRPALEIGREDEERVLHEGVTARSEVMLFDPAHGTPRRMQVSLVPSRSDAGGIQAVLGFAHDITGADAMEHGTLPDPAQHGHDINGERGNGSPRAP